MAISGLFPVFAQPCTRILRNAHELHSPTRIRACHAVLSSGILRCIQGTANNSSVIDGSNQGRSAAKQAEMKHPAIAIRS